MIEAPALLETLKLERDLSWLTFAALELPAGFDDTHAGFNRAVRYKYQLRALVADFNQALRDVHDELRRSKKRGSCSPAPAIF